MAKISELFKKKELTPEEQKKRQFLLELKKIENKIIRNPLRSFDVLEEVVDKIEEGVQKGLVTKEQQQKHIEKINALFERINKIKSKLGK